MQTINDKAIQEAMVTVLQPLLYPASPTPSVYIVSAEQSAPRPSSPTFADIRVVGSRQRGHGELGAIDDDGKTPIAGHYEIEIRFRCVGANAREVATEFQFAMSNRPDVLDAIETGVGLAYSRESEMVHVPALVDDKFESRTQFVVTFFAPVKKLIDLGFIARIEDVVMTFDGIKDPLTIHSGPIEIET